MSTFASMLKEVASSHPHRHTVRKIILLKDRKSYKACLLELKKYGIIPYRQVKSIHMLCCHIDGKDRACRQLQKHPHVHSIETDIKRKRHTMMKKRPRHADKIPWGVSRIHAPEVWGCTRGEGVKVAILDSGISPHPDLVIAGGVNLINPNKSFRDDNGHGTAMAGIIAAIGKNRMPFGVAPRAKLYAVKIFNRNGEGDLSDIIAGLEWCICHHIDVINMSWGILNETSKALHAMVKRVYRKGIVMVAAVSNEGKNSLGLSDIPSGYPEVIAVAATDKSNQIASFSGRGKVNVAAPGVDIVHTNNKEGFEVHSGTSVATPHVTGTIALMLANKPKLSPQLVRKTLMKTAKFLKGFKRNAQGAGLIQANLAVSDCKKRP